MRQHKRLHEITINAWPPLQQIYYDGWILGFSQGYTKRANSIHAAFPSTFEVNTKIDRCEEIYRERKLRPIFRITPFDSPPDLDRYLRERGYERVDPTTLLYLEIKDFKFPYDPVASIAVENLSDWLDAFCKLTRIPKSHKARSLHQKILQSVAGKLCPATFSGYEELLSCAMGTLEEHFFGISDFIVNADHQLSIAGHRFLVALLTWAKHQGATKAYTLVPEDDLDALSFFQSQGFVPAYTFWYRMPGVPTMPDIEELED